ncbi:hypothetical protein H7K02_26605 [Mycobacteroides immunogenum]|nr:hypothetical protein [Mycobacteroides immunogenum]KIU38672.1 hypothetical protein TL11_21385 [Mycobacteroides immunogenum]KPG24964.1 hypothetical protein AN911_04680 [Mycobacteroides immunogenum]KPG36860.1 hypothetical protein AN915_28660 [Mycobacteroides immunogenum]KPG51232.1 hypothetical protein AN916_18760 [Mycobacteroides immunogenum]KPG54918.1 hypothetical protein AN918_29080 [Mycobacteroides immunogenum]
MTVDGAPATTDDTALLADDAALDAALPPALIADDAALVALDTDSFAASLSCWEQATATAAEIATMETAPAARFIRLVSMIRT